MISEEVLLRKLSGRLIRMVMASLILRTLKIYIMLLNIQMLFKAGRQSSRYLMSSWKHLKLIIISRMLELMIH
jgi:hypothetical protein